MPLQECVISDLTGAELKQHLKNLIQDSENWQKGKQYKFNFEIGERQVLVFRIKAMKKQEDIAKTLSFHEDGAEDDKVWMSWEDAKDVLVEEDFASYYKNFQRNRISLSKDNILRYDKGLRVCFMLTYERARWNLAPESTRNCNGVEDAICIAINNKSPNRDDYLEDMINMFPRGSACKFEDDRRKKSIHDIFERKKQEKIDEINSKWPFGERAEELLEILSEKENHRTAAFEKFMERKAKISETLLNEDNQIVTHFKDVLTGNKEAAENAFKQINKLKKKRQNLLNSVHSSDEEN